MALGAVYIGAPAAAAMGLYFFARNLPNDLESGVGMAKMRKDLKAATDIKLAPEFDGLFCFETIVGH